MASGVAQKVKVIALAVLVPLSAWLAYRNVLRSDGPAVAASIPRAQSAPNAARREGSQSQQWTREQLLALDPTLRLDLLEKSRQVKYQGASRNIFQMYTPPAPAPVVPPAAPSGASAATPLAPQPAIPLKFYGMAMQPDATEKKAFLTDGEEIFIAKEGDLVARQYRIVRIGMNSVELEDTRNRQRQQLMLVEQ
ncbi:MAG: hypothetical protein HY648_13600 [Acidobacteria bacterium]|nr:hypothetical protein [Acidobacteriota bacterium]